MVSCSADGAGYCTNLTSAHSERVLAESMQNRRGWAAAGLRARIVFGPVGHPTSLFRNVVPAVPLRSRSRHHTRLPRGPGPRDRCNKVLRDGMCGLLGDLCRPERRTDDGARQRGPRSGPDPCLDGGALPKCRWGSFISRAGATSPTSPRAIAARQPEPFPSTGNEPHCGTSLARARAGEARGAQVLLRGVRRFPPPLGHGLSFLNSLRTPPALRSFLRSAQELRGVRRPLHPPKNVADGQSKLRSGALSDRQRHGRPGLENCPDVPLRLTAQGNATP